MTTRDRMPPIPDDRMTAAQKRAAEEMSGGPRGAVVGPFVAALRSPEFMRRLGSLGEYLRFQNSLGPRLTELAILLVARRWTQQFCWAAHAPIAADRGLSSELIDAIAHGRRPPQLADDEALVFEFVTELEREQAVSDATYARAVESFGEAGVVDLVGAIGYYSLLAMIMNVVGTPLPDGVSPQLGSLHAG
jgi:4-carboxymuconolactone decarboxylase